MPRPTAEQLAEIGRETRWKPGQSGNPNGRPVLDAVEKALREKEREQRIMLKWLEDLESDDPTFRHNVRRDLMDRINGKAAQSMNVTIDELPETDFGF